MLHCRYQWTKECSTRQASSVIYKWSWTIHDRVFKSYRSKMDVIYLQPWNHKAILMITGRAHCFHDCRLHTYYASCFCEIWALCVSWIAKPKCMSWPNIIVLIHIGNNENNYAHLASVRFEQSVCRGSLMITDTLLFH